MKKFGRLLTAMVTPFNEKGQVDYAQARKLAKALLVSGSDGLVALAMANVIMQEGLADTAFINAWTNVKAEELARLDWDDAAARLMQAGQQMLETR